MEQKQHIVNFLIDKGYKPFREDLRNGYELIPCNRPLNFTTTERGGLCVILIKGNSRWCYGLHEAGKPPTLINPKTKNLINQDAMERYLRDTGNDTIFAELYPLSIKQ